MRSSSMLRQAARAALPALILFLTLGPAANSAEADDARYRELVAAAKDDPDSIDYAELRSTYARSSYYKGNESDPMSFFLLKPTPDQVTAFIDNNFAILTTHLRAMPYISPDERQKRIKVMTKMIDAMAKGHNGLTVDGAIRVLAVSEEYDLLALLGLTRTVQALVTISGVSYDKLTVSKTVEGKGPVSLDMWFDVTDLFAANAARRGPPNSNVLLRSSPR